MVPLVFEMQVQGFKLYIDEHVPLKKPLLNCFAGTCFYLGVCLKKNNRKMIGLIGYRCHCPAKDIPGQFTSEKATNRSLNLTE